MKNHLWVIEIQWEKKDRFVPSRQIAKTRDEGRTLLHDWKETLKGVAGIRLNCYDSSES